MQCHAHQRAWISVLEYFYSNICSVQNAVNVKGISAVIKKNSKTNLFKNGLVIKKE